MPRPVAILLALWICAALIPASLAAPATPTVRITLDGQPLEDPEQGKFYVFEPEEREKYLAWGHDGKPARFPEGTYDLVVRFRNDHVQAEQTFENLELGGDIERSVDFRIEMAELTIEITSGGRPIGRYSGKYDVYQAGRRGKPLASKRPAETLVIRPGAYDVEVFYRGRQGLQSRWLEGYQLTGVRRERIDFGAEPARLRLTLLHRGAPLAADRGRWRIHEPGERRVPIAEGGSGEALSVPAGIYDIALVHLEGLTRTERWMNGVELFGDESRNVELATAAKAEDREIPTVPPPTAARPAPKPAALEVEIRRGGALLRDAWFTAYPRSGDNAGPPLSARSGDEIRLPSGTYDIGCFSREGTFRPEKWIENQLVDGRVELDVNLEFRRATIRVLPAETEGQPAPNDERRILLVLDSSFEMAAMLGRNTRMSLATDTLRQIVRDLPAPMKLGLRVYGLAPRSRNDCRDSALVASLGGMDRPHLAATLDLLRPSGFSPIAYSLERAVEDLPSGAGNTVVLVTGSTENCGGGPCAAAARLRRSGAADRIFVVGLGLEGGREQQLSCIGEYHPAPTRRRLKSALEDVFRVVARETAGSFSVFSPGWREWVTGGNLGEKLDVAEGTYDVLVRAGERLHTWEGVTIRGDFVSTAGPGSLSE